MFAAVVGGRPERLGAGMILLACLVTWSRQALVDMTAVELSLVVDALLAIGLGGLLYVYRLTWIGAAACAQTLLLAFSASRMVNFPLSEQGYLIALSLSSSGVFASIAIGAWAKRWGPKDAYAELLAEA